MSYVGKWVFHSIGTITDSDEMVYLDSKAYLDCPMPYIDEADEEAVAGELRERKAMIGMRLEVTEDGKLYVLMPLPEGVSKEEVSEAVAVGEITLRDGMIVSGAENWVERNGELWYTTELSEDGWAKGSDGEFLFFMTVRFARAE